MTNKIYLQAQYLNTFLETPSFKEVKGIEFWRTIKLKRSSPSHR